MSHFLNIRFKWDMNATLPEQLNGTYIYATLPEHKRTLTVAISSSGIQNKNQRPILAPPFYLFSDIFFCKLISLCYRL